MLGEGDCGQLHLRQQRALTGRPAVLARGQVGRWIRRRGKQQDGQQAQSGEVRKRTGSHHGLISFRRLAAPGNRGGADRFRPPNERTYRLEGVTAAGILWKVELETSYVSTRGVPSTNDARSFATSG